MTYDVGRKYNSTRRVVQVHCPIISIEVMTNINLYASSTKARATLNDKKKCSFTNEFIK